MPRDQASNGRPHSRRVDAEQVHLPADGAREREIAAFFAEWFAPALRYAARYVSPDRAEDVVHDALDDVLQRWDDLVVEHRTVEYFSGVVRHKALDEVARESREAEMAAALEHEAEHFRYEAPEPSARMMVAERLEDPDFMAAAVRAFPRRVRQVWLLATDPHHRMSHAEIADVLNVERVTVSRHYQRAVEIIQAHMRSHGLELAPSTTRRLQAAEEVPHE